MLNRLTQLVLTALAEEAQPIEVLASLCGLVPQDTLNRLSDEGLIDNQAEFAAVMPLYGLTALGRFRLRVERAENSSVVC